jgi:hypothetical protein
MKRNVTAQDMPSTDILYYTKLTFVNSGIRKILFFAKHEKKGRCFFAKGSKRYICRFHASQRDILH